jgi:ABC-type phosphate/phosphonate transport system substrate-binding protein
MTASAGDTPQWISGLPMYDFPHLRAAHAALWEALAERLRARGVKNVPRRLTRKRGHLHLLDHPSLLFGQTCEYPLATSHSASAVLVGTPRYGVPGCSGALYCSVVVVREDDPVEELSGLRGRRCAVNEWSSNSGMNLLRAAVAEVSRGEPFFESVVASGSHRGSVALVTGGQADVAAIDCVTFAHLRQVCPAEVARLRVLGMTPSSPSLPFIASRAAGHSTITALRDSLAEVMEDPSLAAVREQLFLDGIELETDPQFTSVRSLERRAAALGYAVLR